MKEIMLYLLSLLILPVGASELSLEEQQVEVPGAMYETETCVLSAPFYKESFPCQKMIGHNGKYYVIYLNKESTQIILIITYTRTSAGVESEVVYVSKVLRALLKSIAA